MCDDRDKHFSSVRSHLNIDYCNEPIKKIYHELFDDALKRYNEKQTRADRRIENYYEKIRNSKQEKPFHELILQIGDKDNMSAESENGQLARQVLDEYYRGFQERNSNLKVFPNLINNGDKTESKKRSVWDIYLQILGLYDFDYDNSPLFVLDTDRTLKPILKNNDLLHPLAEDSFPDRQGLEAILRGEHKSNELVRKTIILLVFYEYWTKRLLKNNVKVYCADDDDNERCYAEINRYLIDAGYPTLYAGNPYDWIFLFAMQDEYPMETFRYFMRELYIIKEDELRASSDSVACTQKTI